MSQTKAERLAEVHARAMDEFDTIQASMRDERMQCLSDRRFYSIAGAQWEGGLGDQFENKPRFEMNKVHLAVIRIFNEYRNNRITVDFTPKDGTDADDLADTCDGLYRADEQDSGAEEAYDNAFEEAVGGGFGAWRLRAAYEDEEAEDDDRQRICFEPIFDADSSVYFDLNAKRQDKADAKCCFVLTSMSPSAYKETYGDDPVSWSKTVREWEFDWITPDVVYVAEYYEVEMKSELIHFFKSSTLPLDAPENKEVRVTDKELHDDDDAKLNELTATGYQEIRQKRIKVRRIHKYIMSGASVLEDEGIIAGKCIPVIPVYGKRWFIDNVERCMGHVRLARDAQQLKNMLISSLGEISTQSAVEKPIFTPEQMSGHQQMWADDSVKRYPYLLVNPITDAQGARLPAGPIGYTKAPSIPPALAALLQITEQDLQDLLGNQQAGEQLQPNMSGKAVELIQNRLDMQVFIYMSNMAKAVKRCGEVWLSMAKDILVEDGRKMKSVGSDGQISSVKLLTPAYDSETGEDYQENDLSRATFDVNVEVGPSSGSRRAATVRALTGMMQLTQDPETLSVLTSMAMMNMEGEGIKDVREYFRNKMVKMGVVKPTPEESQQLQAEAQNQQPDPQAQFLQASADQAIATAQNKNADTILKTAQTGKERADTEKVLSEIATEDQDRLLRAVDAISQLGIPATVQSNPPDQSQAPQQ